MARKQKRSRRRSSNSGARVDLKQSAYASIESLSHDSRGVARVNGKAVFIDGALPGEEVLFSYLKRKGSYDEGGVAHVIKAAPERVKPGCAHFGVCGGCSLQHMAAETQIHAKQQVLLENLKHIGSVEAEKLLPPMTGPLWGYRRKARLGVKYVLKKEKVLVGFREKSSPYLADIEGCEVLHPSVGKQVNALKALVGELSIYMRIPQIEIAVGDDATAMIFRNLEPFIDSDIDKLRAFAQQHNVYLYLQPKGPDTVQLLWPEMSKEESREALCYRLPQYDIEYRFGPTNFVQVNAEINSKMIDKVIELLDLQPEDRVMDLFCGLGNFTLPMAKGVASIVGIEGDDALVELAKRNAKHNGIENTEFYSADLSKPELLPQAGFVLDGQRFDKVLLDPARAGALEMMAPLAKLAPKLIAYVSCNPATLARDADELVNKHGYRMTHVGVMDMFPHTSHVEAMALFVRD